MNLSPVTPVFFTLNGKNELVEELNDYNPYEKRILRDYQKMYIVERMNNLVFKSNGQLQNVVILRSFAIIMVVLYHCYCPWLKAWDWYPNPVSPLYSFIFECVLVGRMPLFVTVSGYLFAHLLLDRGKYSNYGGFLRNKIRRLLVPCLLFMALMCLCLRCNYWEMLFGYGFHLWFLKMLFVSFMVSWPILKYAKGKLPLIFLFLSIVMAFTPGVEFFAIEQFQKYYMFFLGGCLLYKYRTTICFYSSKKWMIIMGIVYLGLLLVILWRYIVGDAYDDIIHSDKIVAFIRLFLRVLFIILAFGIVNFFLCKRNCGTLPRLTRFNKLSFGIYLFHVLYLELFHSYLDYNVLNNYAGSYILSPILLFVAIMSLSVVSAKLVNKTKWGAYLIG